MKAKVVVAMSGGVDSSVAAGLLQRKGYEVIGITMCFGLKEANKKRPSCCGIEGIEDARRVAHKLGIKHYVLNFDKYLQKEVVDNFIGEYLSGRTPNPCIRCNQYLKFERLLAKTKSLGAKYLATGHYARIVAKGSPERQSVRAPAVVKNYLLKKAKDRYKDQSYFLYRLKQEQLRHILFPLGGYTKTQVRAMAGEFDLPVKDKPGSQEICFIPDDDYREFLRQALRSKGLKIQPGPIVDINAKVLGEHKGIPFYTIGQREGLGIAAGYPLYIIRIDAKKNTIVAGRKEEAFSRGLIASDLSFTDKPARRWFGSPYSQSHKPLKIEVALGVKIRYNSPEVPSRVIPFGKGKIKVIFSKSQFAVTPGQAAVFYRKDQVIGGGIVKAGLSNAEIS